MNVDEPGPSTLPAHAAPALAPALAAQGMHRAWLIPFTDGNQADTESGSDWNPEKNVKGKGKQWADLPSHEKDAPTTIEQKRKIHWEVKGTGEYYNIPCSICQKASKRCKIKEARGSCFLCAKQKEKCEHAGPKCRVLAGTKPRLIKSKYITDDMDTDASDVPLACIPVKSALAPASKPKVKAKYVEVTDKEDGSSNLEPAQLTLAPAPLALMPA